MFLVSWIHYMLLLALNRMKMIFIFTSLVFFKSICAQTLQNSYNMGDPFFAISGNYIIIQANPNVHVWHNNGTFIGQLSTTVDSGIRVYADDIYFYIVNSPLGTITRYTTWNLKEIDVHYIEKKLPLWGIALHETNWVIRNYTGAFGMNKVSEYLILNSTTFELINIVKIEVFNIRSSATVFNNGYYLVNYYTGDQPVQVIKKDLYGQYQWDILAEECYTTGADVFTVRIKPYKNFVFILCDNLIYHTDAVTGKLLQKISISSYQAHDVAADDKFMYVATVNAMVFQISLKTGGIVHIYQRKNSLSASIMVSTTQDFVFYAEANGPSPPYFHGMCISGISLLQWKIIKTERKVIYRYFPPNVSLKETALSITHISQPSEGLINTATYVKRFSKIQKVLSQNSFFTPILARDSNNTWNFVYFSGSGNIENGNCGDNFVHKLSIRTFDISDVDSSGNMFEETSRRIFFMKPTDICNTVPSAKAFISASAIFNYAAIFIEFQGAYAYLIHGGTLCFSKISTANVIYISLDDKLNPSYMTVDQNLLISRLIINNNLVSAIVLFSIKEVSIHL